jgi:ribosomal protein S12 methylthiotransferase
MLVGHPGETEEDIVDLLNALDEIKFQRLGVFTYSHEDNTHAYTLEDIIPQEEKQERANRVMEKQMDISWAYNQSLVGTTQKVLFDRLENDHFVGRTQYDSPEVDNEVWVPIDGNYVRMGDFANVLITEATHYDLNGKLV